MEWGEQKADLASKKEHKKDLLQFLRNAKDLGRSVVLAHNAALLVVRDKCNALDYKPQRTA